MQTFSGKPELLTCNVPKVTGASRVCEANPEHIGGFATVAAKNF